jgi:hypothetical protein
MWLVGCWCPVIQILAINAMMIEPLESNEAMGDYGGIRKIPHSLGVTVTAAWHVFHSKTQSDGLLRC